MQPKHPKLIQTLLVIRELGVTNNEALAGCLGASVSGTRVTITRYQASGYVDVLNPGHLPIVFKLSQVGVDLLFGTDRIEVKEVELIGIAESAMRGQPNSVFQLGSF